MLKIIKEELEQYIIKKSFIGDFHKPYKIIEKFELNKNYLMIMHDKNYNYCKAICWLGDYNHDIYQTKLFNYSSHLISKYHNSEYIFYEIEKSFDSKRFYQIITHVFANASNNLLSDIFAVSINNFTIGNIIVDYIKLDHLKKCDNLIFYPEQINFDTDNKINYYYSQKTKI
jgi:hypothetical protein